MFLKNNKISISNQDFIYLYNTNTNKTIVFQGFFFRLDFYIYVFFPLFLFITISPFNTDKYNLIFFFLFLFPNTKQLDIYIN